MKQITLCFLAVIALVFSGCANGNVLAPYRSVTIRPHDRVALGVNITAKKMRYEFHTARDGNQKVRFTELNPLRSFPTQETAGSSCAGDTYYRGINVFEFENRTSHPITVYFDK
ncbi:hypothetical protein CfE428DRAFT_6275 [Chthoniobacter flavus Ellin428]|uniref:Lipoprotein n=1 Tax=Chthoniobacter flavus Ellin428 TaxID=497964 RepID=B4DBI4_9BACT|nr:hypothetical protein [Chthoniobacter flavus]EDY16171.1 hypothetical protein CfE428DRAFT_6275 [Chthoniobacter flavus Ellin428]TCO87172.1 hypothetical protein EV701_1239 [Chthoniobacter flavus]